MPDTEPGHAETDDEAKFREQAAEFDDDPSSFKERLKDAQFKSEPTPLYSEWYMSMRQRTCMRCGATISDGPVLVDMRSSQANPKEIHEQWHDKFNYDLGLIAKAALSVMPRS